MQVAQHLKYKVFTWIFIEFLIHELRILLIYINFWIAKIMRVM